MTQKIDKLTSLETNLIQKLGNNQVIKRLYKASTVKLHAPYILYIAVLKYCIAYSNELNNLEIKDAK